MDSKIYKNICEKLGLDLKSEAIPIIAEEYDGKDILDYLSKLDFIKYKASDK